MKLKALFREYDYPNNVISGFEGSDQITGTGTRFTSVPAGTILEVEDLGYIGKVASVLDDTHLILDGPLNNTFTDQIYWQDWTPYLINPSALARKLETKSVGDSGVIVLDKLPIRFYYLPSITVGGQEVNNPIRGAFAGGTDDKKRFLIRLQATEKGLVEKQLVTNTYARIVDNIGNYLIAAVRGDKCQTIFEGMIDFGTVRKPFRKDASGENIFSISFDLMDKLSALAVLDNETPQRSALTDVKGRLGVAYNIGVGIMKITGTDVGTIYALPVWKVEWSGGSAVKGASVAHPETILKPGDTFKHPDFANKPDKIYFVTDCGFTSVNSVDTTWIKISSSDEIAYDTTWNQFIPQIEYYPADYYNYPEICNYELDAYSRSVITSFNSLAITKALINKFWGDITNEMTSGVKIPLDYYPQLIDSRPFGMSPLEALQFIADSMNAYMWVNKSGKLIIQKRKALCDIPADNDILLPEKYLDEGEISDFWDKLVDAAEITVKSWVKDPADATKYLEGKGSAYLSAVIKPRNKLTKETFLDQETLAENGMSINSDGDLVDPTIPPETGRAEQIKILNKYAKLKADGYIDFYGKRHEAYKIRLVTITWDMLSWDLLSIFSYNSQRFFITNLEFDFVENTLSFDMISIQGYIYNTENVLVAKQVS